MEGGEERGWLGRVEMEMFNFEEGVAGVFVEVGDDDRLESAVSLLQLFNREGTRRAVVGLRVF